MLKDTTRQAPRSESRWVVFTDLDGTLLNADDYRWDDAKPALALLEERGAALVLNSSKTRREMLALREELGNRHPFVVENGAAIFTPAGYFEADGLGGGASSELEITRLGPPREELVAELHRLRASRGWRFEGFADMDVAAVMRHTGLVREAAEAAMDRSGTEPLLWLDDRQPPEGLARALEAQGLRLVAGGRFWHAMGPTDKGTATRLLLGRYRGSGAKIRSLALGDSANDLEMLRSVDHAVWIPGAAHSRPERGTAPGALTAEKPGAAGWRLAVENVLRSAS
ncbi:MAG: HAD-IIB family hydrolase [Acidobacteriota bacterium]